MSKNKKYVVTRKCVALEFVSIEAENQNEALEKVIVGKGKIMTTTLEFERYTDSVFWTVEPLSPPPKDVCLTPYNQKITPLN